MSDRKPYKVVVTQTETYRKTYMVDAEDSDDAVVRWHSDHPGADLTTERDVFVSSDLDVVAVREFEGVSPVGDAPSKLATIEAAVEQAYPGATVEVGEARSGTGEIVLYVYTGHIEDGDEVRRMTNEELSGF